MFWVGLRNIAILSTQEPLLRHSASSKSENHRNWTSQHFLLQHLLKISFDCAQDDSRVDQNNSLADTELGKNVPKKVLRRNLPRNQPQMMQRIAHVHSKEVTGDTFVHSLEYAI